MRITVTTILFNGLQLRITLGWVASRRITLGTSQGLVPTRGLAKSLLLWGLGATHLAYQVEALPWRPVVTFPPNVRLCQAWVESDLVETSARVRAWSRDEHACACLIEVVGPFQTLYLPHYRADRWAELSEVEEICIGTLENPRESSTVLRRSLIGGGWQPRLQLSHRRISRVIHIGYL